MIDNFKDVLEFHTKFDLPRGSVARPMNDEMFTFRTGFLNEELAEFSSARRVDNLVAAIDALLDLNYVAIGTALFVGMNTNISFWPKFGATIYSVPTLHRVREPEFIGERFYNYFISSMQSKIDAFSTLHEDGAAGDHEALWHSIHALRELSAAVYLAAGYLGAPWERCWNHVQLANMAKERAAPDGSNSKRSTGFDVVKPEGWKAPDSAIAAELTMCGWKMPPHLEALSNGKVVVRA